MNSTAIHIAYSPLGHFTNVSVTSLPEVERVATTRGVSPSQVALRWVVQQGRGVVTSTSSVAHTQEDLQVRDLELSSDEMRLLSDVPEACSSQRRGVAAPTAAARRISYLSSAQSETLSLRSRRLVLSRLWRLVSCCVCPSTRLCALADWPR